MNPLTVIMWPTKQEGGEKVTVNERRMKILDVLLQKRQVRLAELQLEFNISKSTAKRDVQELMLSHPIVTSPGKYGGGVRIMDGYRLGMKYLTEKQTALLKKLSENLSGDDLLTMQGILKTFSKPI